MICLMPALNLPEDFRGSSDDLKNRSIPNPPGIVSYRSKNGVDRLDVYIGFIFDGYVKYENHTDRPIQMTFYTPPVLDCKPSDKYDFDPSSVSTISISVSTPGNVRY